MKSIVHSNDAGPLVGGQTRIDNRRGTSFFKSRWQRSPKKVSSRLRQVSRCVGPLPQNEAMERGPLVDKWCVSTQSREVRFESLNR